MNLRTSVEVNVNYLKLIGLAKIKNSNSRAILYYFFTFFMFAFFEFPLAVLPFYQQLFIEPFDMIQLANSSLLNIELTVIPIKVVMMLLLYETFEEALNCLESDLFNSFTREQEETIIKPTLKAVKFGNHYLTLCLTSFTFWTSRNLFYIHTKPLILNMWFPFDPYKNDFCYVFSILYTFFGVGVGTVINGCVVSLLLGLVIHATAQVQILKEKLSALGDISDPSADVLNIFRDKLRNCAHHYACITKYVKLIQKAFSVIMFVEFVGSSVCVCNAVFLLTFTSSKSVNIIVVPVFTICIFSQFYILCYYGNTLLYESSTIDQAIYMSNWTNLDVKSRKDLLILMQHVNAPLCITFGGLMDLSFATFATIVRRIYSLFTVLQTMDTAL